MDIRIKQEYRLKNKPTLNQYRDALQAVSPTEHEIALLSSQYFAPNKTVTSPQLAMLAGIKGGYPTVNSIYGRLGHRLCEKLCIDPDDGSGSEKDRWWSILSVGYSTENGFLWQMHTEVAVALEQLGWIQSQEQLLPEEINESLAIFEGAVRNIRVNVFERNPQARRRCIEHHGKSCCICGFDFAVHYGVSTANYIHVHHLRPLSEIAEQYEIDPIRDLRPVCPNCHAVIHLRVPPYTIEEVKDMLCKKDDAV